MPNSENQNDVAANPFRPPTPAERKCRIESMKVRLGHAAAAYSHNKHLAEQALKTMRAANAAHNEACNQSGVAKRAYEAALGNYGDAVRADADWARAERPG
jgi:hypothetical protein